MYLRIPPLFAKNGSKFSRSEYFTSVFPEFSYSGGILKMSPLYLYKFRAKKIENLIKSGPRKIENN